MKDNIEECLEVSEYINQDNEIILAKAENFKQKSLDEVHSAKSIYKYKKATMEDIEELVRTRITVLRAANQLSDDVDMSEVEKKESYEYYKYALENGGHIAYLVFDNGKFIGAGGVSFYRVMPTYYNQAGERLIL